VAASMIPVRVLVAVFASFAAHNKRPPKMSLVDIEYVQLRFLTDYTGALLKSEQNGSLPRDRNALRKDATS
jgi:hypothetical protein